MHTCKSSISEVEAGVSEVQGQCETSQEELGKGGRKGGEGRERKRAFVGMLGGLVTELTPWNPCKGRMRETILQWYTWVAHS